MNRTNLKEQVRSAPDFMSLEHFSLKTGIPKAHITWIISKRKSNGANFFLYTIGPQNTWMLSPSLYEEWKQRKNTNRDKIQTGDTT